ncbi:MAG: hypothetical protein U0L53_01985 [Bacteroidales bacterium]|nr:hypothetical protein [Bacteroidales bacterium]
MKQSVSPCETHSTGKLKFFDTAFGDFFSLLWLFSRKVRKAAKAEGEGQQVNETTRQQDLRPLRLCEKSIKQDLRDLRTK